jgi:hypothetical protein
MPHFYNKKKYEHIKNVKSLLHTQRLINAGLLRASRQPAAVESAWLKLLYM